MKNGGRAVAPFKPQVVIPVRGLVIRKNITEELLLRRIREFLLFSKLRSLVPPLEERAMEYEPCQDEVPTGDYDEENLETSKEISKKEEDEDEVVFEESSDGEDDEAPKPFVPSIKILSMEGALLISTVVLKDVALSSALFSVLEEEKLDILFENQYRTETRVSHTIHVRITPAYDVEALERKLFIWAGKESNIHREAGRKTITVD